MDTHCASKARERKWIPVFESALILHCEPRSFVLARLEMFPLRKSFVLSCEILWSARVQKLRKILCFKLRLLRRGAKLVDQRRRVAAHEEK
jgi:hypothetical protein